MPRRPSFDDNWYPYAPPRPIADGIKAKTTRGAFGTSWWAKRWIAVLEGFDWGSRLQRGRSYARRGQVVSIDVKPGQVHAKVQGSRPTPYTVHLTIPPLTDAQWEHAIERMAQQAIFAAKLLAGEMPQNIEDAFAAAHVSLFPQDAHAITMACSCPDWAEPCKHTAAVYYLLGEQFDDDPFLMFQIRGRTRAHITEALQAQRAAAADALTGVEAPATERVPALVDLVGSFYQAGSEFQNIDVQITAPDVEAGMLQQLGAAPAGTDADLRAVYRAMTAYALHKVFGAE